MDRFEAYRRFAEQCVALLRTFNSPRDRSTFVEDGFGLVPLG